MGRKIERITAAEVGIVLSFFGYWIVVSEQKNPRVNGLATKWAMMVIASTIQTKFNDDRKKIYLRIKRLRISMIILHILVRFWVGSLNGSGNWKFPRKGTGREANIFVSLMSNNDRNESCQQCIYRYMFCLLIMTNTERIERYTRERKKNKRTTEDGGSTPCFYLYQSILAQENWLFSLIFYQCDHV